MVLEIEGKDLKPLDTESGGVRIQRVPPTERKNRVHTSTVTVATLQVDDVAQTQVNDDDFRIDWFSGTGAGGQHRNKSQNSCRITHLPTGFSETRQSRSRSKNLEDAKKALLQQLLLKRDDSVEAIISADKKQKLGTGMRGDKFITIQFQNDRVTHHRTGKTCRVKDFMAGHWELLWNQNDGRAVLATALVS